MLPGHALDVGIGDRIKQAREALGIDQKTAAKRAGINEGAWSRAENELVDVKATTLLKIATTLGVSASFLLGQSSEASLLEGEASGTESGWPDGLPPKIRREIEAELFREETAHRDAMRAFWRARRAQLLADRGFD